MSIKSIIKNFRQRNIETEEFKIDTIIESEYEKQHKNLVFHRVVNVLLILAVILQTFAISTLLPLKEKNLVILESFSDEGILIKTTIIDEDFNRTEVIEKAEIRRYVNNRESYNPLFENEIRIKSSPTVFKTYDKLKTSINKSTSFRNRKIIRISKAPNGAWIVLIKITSNFINNPDNIFNVQNYIITIVAAFNTKNCKQTYQESEINPLCMQIQSYEIASVEPKTSQ